MSDSSQTVVKSPLPNGSSDKKSFLGRLLSWVCWVLVIFYFLLAAIILSARFLLVPYIQDHKSEIEKSVSTSIGMPLKVDSISAAWHYIFLTFNLKGIQLGVPNENPLKIDEISASLSYMSLLEFKPIFLNIQLDAPSLKITRLGPNTFRVLGKTVNFASSEPSSSTRDPLKALDLLLKQRRIAINNGTLTFSDVEGDKVLTLDDISARYRNFPVVKRFALNVHIPEEIGTPLDVRLEARPSLTGNPLNLKTWNATLYTQADRLNFDEVAKWMPDFDVKYDGIATGSLWINFKRWEPTGGTFIGALSGVDLTLAPDLKTLQLKELKGKISTSIADNTYELNTRNFEFELEDGKRSPSLDLAVKLKKDEQGNWTEGSFDANIIQIRRFTDLFPSLPLPKEFKEFVTARQFNGELTDVHFLWLGDLEKPQNYRGNINFNNLSSEGATGRDGKTWLPGFKNLTGTMSMQANKGSATFNSEKAQLALPGIFPVAAFDLYKLTGDVSWEHTDNWKVSFNNLSVANKDLAAAVSGIYQQNQTPLGYLDLDINLQRANAAATWKYVPLIAEMETIRWLRYGLLGGKATHGVGKLKGNLEHFPFVNSADELFKISLNVEDVTLDVYPNKMEEPLAQAKKGAIWPLFSKVQGTVDFIGDSMKISATHGEYRNVNIDHALVEIPSFSADTIRLTVDASAAGELPQFLHYVDHSPVREYTGGIFSKATAAGTGLLKLGLKIPLSGPGDVAVNGAFTLQDDEFNFNQYSIPALKNAKGTVTFSEKGAQSKDLSANCWGQPVKATINTKTNGEVQVHASGHFATEALPEVVPIEFLSELSKHYLKGSAPFDVNVNVNGQNLTVDVKSSLKGIESRLPAPLAKATDSTNNLEFSLKQKPEQTDLSMFIHGLFSGEFVLKDDKIVQAAIGNTGLPSLPKEGYAISINAPVLSITQWSDVFKSLPDSSKTQAHHSHDHRAEADLPVISSVQIDIKKLLIEHFNQENFTLFCTHSPTGLQANIRSDELKGTLEWNRGEPGKQQPELFAHFNRLYIPDSADEVAKDTKPVEIKGGWPAISAVIDDLTYGKMRLGKIELKARNTRAAQGHLWQIQKLSIQNPDANLLASGSWLKSFDGKNRTSLLINNQIGNLGGLLDRLSYGKLIYSGHGTLKGELSWDGTPLGFNAESFDGTLNVNLTRGEILKIEPGAGAKLLSLLSLQSLTRYLTLDFRDFYSKGFNFNTIKGDAKIDDGLMNIKDLTIIGSSATIVMNGDVNIKKETEQLKILVLPDINAAGASVALAIANPIAGIGSFLAQLIFKDPLSKLFSFEYEVTGTWSEPIVKKVERDHL